MLARRTLLAASLGYALPPPERIVLRLPENEIIRADWSASIDAPAQPGSLWKPFLAAAHHGPAPRYFCDGRACWLGRRHGWLDLPGALAHSCNQWFHQLYRSLPQPVRFPGLPTPDGADWTQWSCPPRQLVLAYAELFARRLDHPLVMAGLRQAAEQGTAKALGRGYLAKTGTGPSLLYAGDGWVMAAAPADAPVRLVLYRQRGATGASAASALARLLRKDPL